MSRGGGRESKNLNHAEESSGEGKREPRHEKESSRTSGLYGDDGD